MEGVRAQQGTATGPQQTAWVGAGSLALMKVKVAERSDVLKMEGHVRHISATQWLRGGCTVRSRTMTQSVTDPESPHSLVAASRVRSSFCS